MNHDDQSLLREFVATQSEPAFAALVERHIGLVHSAALRRVGNEHLAGEITQAVFILLARKAGALGPNTILPAWLYRATHYVTADALKTQRRRALREQEAYMQSSQNEPEPPVWREIAPQLEAAMAALNDRDRTVVLLRYFEDKSLTEVAAATGLSEDAARVRVNRALDKLLRYFTRRGISSTAAMLAGALANHSVQIPPSALAKMVTATALANGTTASASTLTLIKGALKIMAWSKAKTTVIGVTVILLTAGTATPFAVQHYRHAAQTISSVHIRGQMRTYPNDNFSALAPDDDFVPIEVWKQFTPTQSWRVEKPGRVVVMDGQTTLAYFKANKMAIKVPQPLHDAFDTDWLINLANFKDALTNQLRTAQSKGWQVDTATAWVAGKKKTVLTINVKSGLPNTSEQKNQFFGTADQREVYRFDEQTMRLESAQFYLEEAAGETLVFESTQIDYNQPVAPALFQLALPADVFWYQEPQKTAGPDPLAKLTADQAAHSFFEACSRKDWAEVAKFWNQPINDRLKEYLGEVKLVHLGAAYPSAPYPGQFVPYEIEMRPQEINVRVSNTNAAGRYVIAGTYDRKLQLQEAIAWTTQPPTLAENDIAAKLAPAEAVKAYFQAMAKSDWAEMAKFTTEADVATTKRQVEEAKKLGVPLPEFEVGEAFWSDDHSAQYVKCHMKWTKKFRLAIRNDNPAKHWIVDGGL